MGKIYICNTDTIEMDLLAAGIDDDHMEDKIGEVLDDLKTDRNVIEIDNSYILGEMTATYLKLEYDINTSVYEIE